MIMMLFSMFTAFSLTRLPIDVTYTDSKFKQLIGTCREDRAGIQFRWTRVVLYRGEGYFMFQVAGDKQITLDGKTPIIQLIPGEFGFGIDAHPTVARLTTRQLCKGELWQGQ